MVDQKTIIEFIHNESSMANVKLWDVRISHASSFWWNSSDWKNVDGRINIPIRLLSLSHIASLLGSCYVYMWSEHPLSSS